jgi:hypothetical protein
LSFSERESKDGKALIFKIYASSQNTPLTNIEIPNDDWTFYPSEQEVVLFPFFAYQVLETTMKEGVKQITLMELPF